MLVCLSGWSDLLSCWSVYWSVGLVCLAGLSVDLAFLACLVCLVGLVYLVGLVCLMVCLLVYLASLVCLLTSMLVGCLFVCLLVCLYDLHVGRLVCLVCLVYLAILVCHVGLICLVGLSIFLVGSIGFLVSLLVGRSGLSGWSVCWSIGLPVGRFVCWFFC